MNPQANLQIILVMVFAGGFFVAVTVSAFILFARFLDREKVAADRFRAEHDVRDDRG